MPIWVGVIAHQMYSFRSLLNPQSRLGFLVSKKWPAKEDRLIFHHERLPLASSGPWSSVSYWTKTVSQCKNINPAPLLTSLPPTDSRLLNFPMNCD